LGIQSGDIFPSSINGIQINFQQKELPQMQPIVNNILITQKLRGRDIVLGIARENQSQRKTT
jgi:hypothetical protein